MCRFENGWVTDWGDAAFSFLRSVVSAVRWLSHVTHSVTEEFYKYWLIGKRTVHHMISSTALCRGCRICLLIHRSPSKTPRTNLGKSGLATQSSSTNFTRSIYTWSILLFLLFFQILYRILDKRPWCPHEEPIFAYSLCQNYSCKYLRK